MVTIEESGLHEVGKGMVSFTCDYASGTQLDRYESTSFVPELRMPGVRFNVGFLLNEEVEVKEVVAISQAHLINAYRQRGEVVPNELRNLTVMLFNRDVFGFNFKQRETPTTLKPKHFNRSHVAGVDVDPYTFYLSLPRTETVKGIDRYGRNDWWIRYLIDFEQVPTNEDI